MHRFFIKPECIISNEIHFLPEVSRQMTRVLRIQIDEEIVVLDNSGKEYLTILTCINEKQCQARILKSSICRTEPETRLTLGLGLTQREKFEWMLQKCTEIGVSTFQPIISSRTLTQSIPDTLRKYPRWNKILQEAAEQSGRGKIPELLEPKLFSSAVEGLGKMDQLCLIPWEEEKARSIKVELRQRGGKNVAIVIGPEGGFSPEEVLLAEAHGFIPVTLGKRILRMETAAVVSTALVLYEQDDLI